MPPNGHPRKKPLNEKFKLVKNEWKPIVPGGNWQTVPGSVDIPPNAEPWLVNLRMWVCEMNQWAGVVHGEIHELRDEVDRLKRPAPPPPPPGAVPAPR